MPATLSWDDLQYFLADRLDRITAEVAALRADPGDAEALGRLASIVVEQHSSFGLHGT